jgi:DNA-binding transcriptional ArsR family regulator
MDSRHRPSLPERRKERESANLFPGSGATRTYPHSKPSSAGSDNLDVVFSALSSPTRRAILAMLSKGESTVTDLARPFDMSLPAISKHLRILENAHVITVTRDGRTHRCRLAPTGLTRAEKWISFYGRMWEGQLDSLAEFLKTRKGGRS